MAYRANSQIIFEMERLYKLYETEVNERVKDGCLKRSTANTYLLHSGNFVEWCKGKFFPGIQKFNQQTRPNR